jgi:hypothetical protein
MHLFILRCHPEASVFATRPGSHVVQRVEGPLFVFRFRPAFYSLATPHSSLATDSRCHSEASVFATRRGSHVVQRVEGPLFVSRFRRAFNFGCRLSRHSPLSCITKTCLIKRKFTHKNIVSKTYNFSLVKPEFRANSCNFLRCQPIFASPSSRPQSSPSLHPRIRQKRNRSEPRAHTSTRPPSTAMICPVTKSDFTRYATASAMSSPVPVRCSGTRSI